MAAAIIFNPLKDLKLMYGGREYLIPKGISRLTDQKFSAPDEYRKFHPSQPDKDAMLETTIEAVEFASKILNRHYTNYFDAGILVGTEEPADKDKEVAKRKCDQWKRKQIDIQLTERDERKSGGHGRLTLDDEIIEWMVEFGIEDKMYNPRPNESVHDQKLAEVVASATSKALAEVLGGKR